MLISILTLFPEMFAGPFDYSIIKRAQAKGLVSITLTNIRDFATGAYKSVDDHPYGGGVGMVLRVDVLDRALKNQKSKSKNQKSKVILLDPRGERFTQKKARELSKLDHLILISGHYEGVDERVKQLVDESISIGDYVLTGGELPAMIVTDAIVRLLPGVLKKEATSSESFSLPSPSLTRLAGALAKRVSHPSSLAIEYPQYTRPEVYKGMRVPAVLLSGNHNTIAAWKKNHTTARKDRASRQSSPA